VTVAFRLPGNIAIYFFSMIIALGVIIGIIWSSFWSSSNHFRRVFVSGTWALIGGFLGAKIGYLGVNWAFYWANPDQILTYPFGGLVWPGSLIGGVLGLWLFSLVFRSDFWVLADSLVPLLISIVIVSWLGCWMDGCAYGSIGSKWLSVPAKDEWGNLMERWPVQLIGAVTTLFLGLGLDVVRRQKWMHHSGRIAFFALFVLGVEFYWLSFLRADPTMRWEGQRLDTWAALSMITVSGFSFLLSFFPVFQTGPKNNSE